MIANSLVVNGAARFLNKIYANDLQASGTTSFTDLSVSGTSSFTGKATFNGHVAIGGYNNTSTNGTLSTHGLYTNEWLRSVGSVGWYSQTYGGGIYMKDTTYVRTYNNKSFFVENGNLYVGTTNNSWNSSGNLVTSTIKATSAQLDNLQVNDTLRSFKWDIDHVANLGGNFLVTPTYNATENSATFVVNSISGTTITATINDSIAISGSVLGGVTWAKDSKIKITGKIGGVVLPVCEGKLTNQLNSSSGTMNIQFTYPNQSSNSLSVKTYGASEVSGLTVMLLTVGATNPIGIYMTARDSNNYSHISLYGGTDTKPVVRIGNLQGLDPVGGIDPDDSTVTNKWGIYTYNGFFKGVIAAERGVIGSNTTVTNNWQIGDRSIWYGNKTPGASTTALVISTGTSSTNSIAGSGTSSKTWMIAAGTGFGVTNTGVMYATGAHVSGEITAESGTIGGASISNGVLQIKEANISGTISGNKITATSISADRLNITDLQAIGATIGGFAIDATSIHTKNVAVTSNADNSIALSSADFTRTINSTSREGLRFAIGDKFGLTGDGAIYASSGLISGSIISTGISAANITSDTLNAARIAAGSLALEKLTTAAQTTISDAAKTATTYITDIDTKKGITIKPSDSSGNDYLQMNSSAISFYRNNIQTTKMEDSAIRVGKLGTNLRNVYITDSAVQIRNNTDVLAEYGSAIKLYKPGDPTTAVVTIDSNGGTFTGSIAATSGTIGSNSTAGNRWQIGDKAIYNTTNSMTSTGVGTYVGVDGIRNYKDANTFVNIQNGKITAKAVDLSGTITATTGTFGNGTNKITVGNGGTANSAIYYGMTTLSDTTHNGFYIGTDGIALGKGSFKVTSDGTIYASSGLISGSIISTGINAANISTGTLSADRIEGNSLELGKLTTAAQTTISDAAKTATNYLTYSSSSGLTIGYSGSSSKSVINNNGMEIFNGSNKSTAFFGLSNNIAISRIGLTSDSNIIMTNGGIDLRYKNFNIAHIGYGSTWVLQNNTFVQHEGEYFSFGSASRKNYSQIGKSSFSIGYNNVVSGYQAFATGEECTASGSYSHAEGNYTTASGERSHAEGWYTTASGHGSHAEGYQTIASGDFSHAEGDGTMAKGVYSHAEGENTQWFQSVTIGNTTYTTAGAYGDSSHSEGRDNLAIGSHSHAEGESTIAKGDYSHAEGVGTKANGYASHAGGSGSIAGGMNTFAHGDHAQAQSENVAFGLYTIAHAQNQFVIGRANIESNAAEKYAFIIGNGTVTYTTDQPVITRSNALTVDWSGNLAAVGTGSFGGSLSATSNIITTSGSIIIDSKSKGYYLKDKNNNRYSAIHDNGNNLCIGHSAGANYHHVGGTYISSGWDATNTKGNETIYITVPNSNSTYGGNTITVHSVYHTGNLTNATTSKAGLMSAADKTAVNHLTVTNLTATRTTNSYINSNSFRVTPVRMGNLVVTSLNCTLSTAFPKPSDFIQIGTITGATIKSDARVTVPTTGGMQVTVSLTSNGELKIYNHSSTSATGIIRCQLVNTCS